MVLNNADYAKARKLRAAGPVSYTHLSWDDFRTSEQGLSVSPNFDSCSRACNCWVSCWVEFQWRPCRVAHQCPLPTSQKSVGGTPGGTDRGTSANLPVCNCLTAFISRVASGPHHAIA